MAKTGAISSDHTGKRRRQVRRQMCLSRQVGDAPHRLLPLDGGIGTCRRLSFISSSSSSQSTSTKHKAQSTNFTRRASNRKDKMKIVLPAVAVAIVVLGGAAAAAEAASPPPGQQQQQQQLRRNAQEIPEVAATATAAATITGMIGVDAVDMVMGPECTMMCETMKCHDHCSSKCSDEAKHIADRKWKYCKVYGPDAPPLAPELPDRLHLEHKHHHHHLDHHKKHFHACSEMHPCDECQGDCNTDDDCSGDLKCFHRDSANPTASVPGCSGLGQPKVDYCYSPDQAGGIANDACGAMIGYDVPKNCSSYSTCIYDKVLETYLNVDYLQYEIAKQAKEDCKAGLLPVYNASLPSNSSGYADSTCDYMLTDPIDKTKCDAFYTCVLDWETNSSSSTARTLSSATKTEAEGECSALADANDLSDPIFGKYVGGKCDDHLGGWEQTCDKYHECNYAPRKLVCDYCSMPMTTGMYQCDPMEQCTTACHDDCLFKVSCEEMCSMMTSP